MALQALEVHMILLAAERGRKAAIQASSTEIRPEELNAFPRESPEWLAFNMGWRMHRNPGKLPF